MKNIKLLSIFFIILIYSCDKEFTSIDSDVISADTGLPAKVVGVSWRLSKILNLVDPITNKPLNHTLRYWEKQFKEIRPKKINNRRYYTLKQVEIIKMIKYLLRSKGMTISGVKNSLNLNVNKLDDHNSNSLKVDYYKKNLKTKSKLLLEKINRIRSYGKKNSS